MSDAKLPLPLLLTWHCALTGWLNTCLMCGCALWNHALACYHLVLLYSYACCCRLSLPPQSSLLLQLAALCCCCCCGWPPAVCRLVVDEDVRTVLQLQEDTDMAYFSLDLAPIKARCEERGDINHVRHRIRDFDPFSLRMELPGAVALLAQQAAAAGGTSYVHCTAGLGRAPAVALAWMWWYKGYGLEEAYELLTGKRPCKPKTAAIRAAAADILFGAMHTRVTLAVHRRGFAKEIQVSGPGGWLVWWRLADLC